MRSRDLWGWSEQCDDMAPPGKGAALASAKRTHPQAQIEAGQALPSELTDAQ
jgi:hypothetical protein